MLELIIFIIISSVFIYFVSKTTDGCIKLMNTLSDIKDSVENIDERLEELALSNPAYVEYILEQGRIKDEKRKRYEEEWKGANEKWDSLTEEEKKEVEGDWSYADEMEKNIDEVIKRRKDKET